MRPASAAQPVTPHPSVQYKGEEPSAEHVAEGGQKRDDMVVRIQLVPPEKRYHGARHQQHRRNLTGALSPIDDPATTVFVSGGAVGRRAVGQRAAASWRGTHVDHASDEDPQEEQGRDGHVPEVERVHAKEEEEQQRDGQQEERGLGLPRVLGHASLVAPRRRPA